MWLNNWFKNRPRPSEPRRRSVRLCLERLEDRTMPSNFTAGNVADLIADINAANDAGGSNTIALVAGTTFTLTAPYGPYSFPGLPAVEKNDNLTIIGNGDTIERSAARNTSAFGLLWVYSGAALTLENMTLQGGLTIGEGGGAISSAGALTMINVTVQHNTAEGGPADTGTSDFFLGGPVFGGGIASGGSLTLQNCTIQSNQALGMSPGTDAFGGGLSVTGGTATLTNVTLTSNTAQAGPGSSAYGGGLYVENATISLHNVSLTENVAKAGKSPSYTGDPRVGIGGGLYIDPSAVVYLDAVTRDHIRHNHAETSNNDVFGTYVLIP
jgi:hypothetical protein